LIFGAGMLFCNK